MSDTGASLHARLAKATALIVEQLADIMLDEGVAYGTFEEWCRKAFIDAAEAKLAARKQKISTSSVSALTGINRKETKRLREIKGVEYMSDSSSRFNRAIRVINGWSTDAEFLNRDGSPRMLLFTGDDPENLSFADLVKRYSGDMSPNAVLDMLVGAGCVELDDDRAKLVKTTYVPDGVSAGLNVVDILGADTAALISTIGHNLKCSAEHKFFQRKVYHTALKSDYVEAFKALSSGKSQTLLVELNEWIQGRTVNNDAESGEYVSINIFFSNYNKT